MTTHRERLLGQARADLVALPDLDEERQRMEAGERHHDISGYRGKVIGSPSPADIPNVHLSDTRHKPGWWGEDPRYRDLGDRYGIAPTLETWVRILWHELPEIPDLTEIATVRSECATLLEHWTWICEQQWAVELAEDVTRIANQVRAQLGIRPEPEYACPQCHNPAYLQPGGILACTEVQEHHIVIRDLEQQQRRRPPMSSKQITEEFDVTLAQLWQWKHRRKIAPTKTERGKHWWLPWDVFCLLNPDIAEAIERRDDIGGDAAEQAQAHVP